MDKLSERLAQALFEEAKDTTFEIVNAGDAGVALVLRLFEVNGRPAPRGYEQYSALFRGPASPMLPQATYAFRHPTIGELPLFIVPISRDDDGVVYEACVSRRVRAPDAGTSSP